MIATRLRGFSVWGVFNNLTLIWYNMNTMKAKNAKKTITDSTVDQDVLTYTVGEDTILDKALIKWDCMGTAAHVTMLSEMKGLKKPVVTKKESSLVRKELAKIVYLAEKGSF